MSNVPPFPEWELKAHPAYLMAETKYLEDLASKATKDSPNASKSRQLKKLEYLYALTRLRIPADPSRDSYRLGNTLGVKHTFWRRAKFLQQYRIFFRYSSTSKLIVYAWANDDETLRAFGSKTDAYIVFKRMIESGKVPSSWDELMAEAEKLS